jgi:TolB protein
LDKQTKFTAPNVSPDGNRLLFDLVPSSNGDYDQSRLMVLDIAGESKGSLDDLDYGKSPRWSPDGKRITFAVHPGNPKNFEPGVWVMDADGSNLTRVADGSWPHWSRDGRSLITKNYNAAGVYLIKVDIETKQETPFLPDLNHQWQMHLSPDGERVLAYYKDDDGKHLITIDADGDKKSIVELATGDISHLGYSPDGSAIFYSIANRVGGNDIYVCPPKDKSQAKRLNVLPKVVKEQPCWSHDGKRIFFCAPVDVKLDE